MTEILPSTNSHRTYSSSPPRIYEIAEYNPNSCYVSTSSPYSLPDGYTLQYSPHDYPPSSLNWADNVLRYIPETDSLRVFFRRTDPADIKSTTRVTEGLDVFAAKDEAGKICYLEFRQADNILVPHTFDTTSNINEQPPLQLSHCYDSISDFFYIDLVSQEHAMKLDIVNLYDPTMTIIFDVENTTRRVSGFQIMGASRCIVKDIIKDNKQ